MPKLEIYNTSTHNNAVQASAYRLIALLKTRHNKDAVCDWGKEGDLSLAQGSLLGYINNLGEEERELARSNPHIGSTIQVIDRIQREAGLLFESKQAFLKGMLYIASLYPGNCWNQYQAHWSQNLYYVGTDQASIMLMTPPAEALNLVCAGLLQGKNHHPESDEKERLKKLFDYIVELAGTEQKKCAAGLQHDLLHMLADTYIDEERKPFEWVTNEAAFIRKVLSMFIQEKMHAAGRLDELCQRWSLWASTCADTKNPIIEFLDTNIPDWINECRAYSQAQFIQMGIKPPAQEDKDIITNIDELPPLAESAAEAVVLALLSEKRLPELPATHQFSALIPAVNEYLRLFKQGAPYTPLREHTAVYAGFLFSVSRTLPDLIRYSNVTLLIGEEDKLFIESAAELANYIQTCLERTSDLQAHHFEEFEQRKQIYRQHEQNFLKYHPHDVISNFFVLTRDSLPNQVIAQYQQLKLRMPAAGFILTDEVIEKWQTDNSENTDEGTILYLDPYTINRLFLHAIQVKPQNWSPIFCCALLRVLQWLRAPTPDGLLVAVKENYPKNFLANLMLIVHTKIRYEQIDSRIRKYVFMNEIFLLHFHKSFFAENIRVASPEMLNNFLTLFQDVLTDIIQDLSSLAQLFSLPKEKLNTLQRDIILETFKGKLADVMRRSDCFCDLFFLSESKLNSRQRNLIWDEVKDKLVTLIQDGSQMADIFSLLEEQFDNNKRNYIFENVKDKLDVLMQNAESLRSLFALSNAQLNAEQRSEIWAVVRNRLNVLIHDDKALRRLFALSNAQLNAEQRSEIWSVVRNRLDVFIQNAKSLISLFALSDAQLNAEQRSEIWSVVRNRLNVLIEDDKLLKSLFALSDAQLNAEQRDEILSSIRDRLPSMFKFGFELQNLFSLSFTQLNIRHRKYIIDSLGAGFRSFVQGAEIIDLFDLLEIALDEQQKILVLGSLTRQLDALDVRQLKSLFEINRLSDIRKTCILHILKNKLSDLMPEVIRLKLLFELSNKQLTHSHRDDILFALKANLGLNLIRSEYQLQYLFDLSEEQLSDLQRNFILDAIKQNLASRDDKRRFAFLNSSQKIEILLALNETESSDKPLDHEQKQESQVEETKGSVTSVVSDLDENAKHQPKI